MMRRNKIKSLKKTQRLDKSKRVGYDCKITQKEQANFKKYHSVTLKYKNPFSKKLQELSDEVQDAINKITCAIL